MSAQPAVNPGDGPSPKGPAAPAPISQLMGELVVDLLETTGLIPEAKVGLLREKAKHLPVVQVLIDEGLASSEAIARIVAAQHGLPVVELGAGGIDPMAAEAVPLHVLEQMNAIPYAFDGDELCVAISDPQNIHGIDALRLASRHPIALRVASSEEIAAELGRLTRTAEAFGTRSGMNDIDVLEVIDEDELDDLEVDDGISDAPLVRLVNSIIFEAAEDGASDVHFEPQSDALVVRFRIDGVLHETQRIPKRSAIGVTTRLKVLAKLDIAERRKPQDGRISLSASAAGRMLDVRVATLPTVEGESVVMRLLDKSKEPPTMEQVGLGTAMQERLAALIHRPTGALLVTGPTGSGKSTTLFAAMAEINRPEINVITVEDPVEYRLAGLNQVQINPRAGPHVRHGIAFDPPLGPRRSDGRRDSRRRDREDLDRGCPDRPLRPLYAAHERRAERADAPERDGRRTIPDRSRRDGRARAAPRAPALRALQGAVRAWQGGAGHSAHPRGARARQHRALPPQRLRSLPADRL